MACAPASAQAQAQEDLPRALDRAGNAVNRALGEAFGLPQKPAPRTRSSTSKQKPKPKADASAKPDASAKSDAPAKPNAPIKPGAAAKPESTPTATKRAPAVAETADVPLPPERPVPRGAALAPAAAEPAPAEPNPSRNGASQDRPASPPVPQPFPTSRQTKPIPAPIAAPEPSPPVAPEPEPAPAAKSSDSQRVALVPLPRPNPERAPSAIPAALPPAAAVPEPKTDAPPPAGPDVASGCPELAEAGIAVFAVAEPPSAKGACGIERPVRLSAVRIAGGREVELAPVPLLRCDMAVAVARWIREEIDPLVATLGSPLKQVEVAASYDCRPRNRVSGAKMSEHGRGNAMDTRGYRLEDGRAVRIGGRAKEAMPVAFQERLKASACGRFMTILGPGSDGYHEEHLHVDLQPRRSKMSLCRWAVRDMDAPKPAATPAPVPKPEPKPESGAVSEPAGAAKDEAAPD